MNFMLNFSLKQSTRVEKTISSSQLQDVKGSENPPKNTKIP